MIQSIDELEAIYGEVSEGARRKEVDHLIEPYRQFVAASPLAMLASVGEEGLDCSPKGDAPGFARVLDPNTIAIPDRRGNNRIDNLRNIVRDPRVSLLFLIPGVSETLRVNGRAAISADPDLLADFAVDGKPPRTVILVTVERVYFHCAKAMLRSKLWQPESWPDRAAVPTSGEMLRCIIQGDFDGDQYDRDLPARLAATLY
jgi:PPOX class probable FMN-dependent enzyme